MYGLLDWRPLGPIEDWYHCTARVGDGEVCQKDGAAPLIRRDRQDRGYEGEAACAEHATLPLRLRLLTVKDPF